MAIKSTKSTSDSSKKSASKIQKLLTDVMKVYETKCEQFETSVCLTLRKAIKRGIEEDTFVTKFVVDPQDRKIVEYWDDAKLIQLFNGELEDRVPSLKKKKNKKKINKEERPLVKVLPFLEALRNKHYTVIEELFVSSVYMDNSDMLALAGLVQKGSYLIKSIELTDCFIDEMGISTFVPSVNYCNSLRELSLDFNEFGDDGCRALCNGLMNCKWIVHLSICFCDLRKQSGLWLGTLIAESPIRELYLDGNTLEAEGAIALISTISEAAANEGFERQEAARLKHEQNTADSKQRYNFDSLSMNESNASVEATSVKSKKTKKGKGKSRQVESPPSGPQICVLSLAENAINYMGRGGYFAPVRCMQLLKVLIENSVDLQEIDIFGNEIGDLGARQLLEGLVARRTWKLPQIGLRVGHQIHQDTYDAICKLAPGVKSKKGKKRNK